VSVHCSTDGRATRAEVTYDLTALTKTAQAALQQFADGYDNFLSEWERHRHRAGARTGPGRYLRTSGALVRSRGPAS
jgi:hypothetical protein